MLLITVFSWYKFKIELTTSYQNDYDGEARLFGKEGNGECGDCNWWYDWAWKNKYGRTFGKAFSNRSFL